MKGFPPQESSLSSPGHQTDALLGSLPAGAEVWQNKTATENVGKGYSSRTRVLLLGSRDHLPAGKAWGDGLPLQHPEPDLCSTQLPTTLNHLSHNGHSAERLHSYKFTCCLLMVCLRERGFLLRWQMPDATPTFTQLYFLQCKSKIATSPPKH